MKNTAKIKKYYFDDTNICCDATVYQKVTIVGTCGFFIGVLNPSLEPLDID
jgi:hypothetical protein